MSGLLNVLETIDEGVYGVDSSGRVTLVNRAALEITGFSREELAGGASHELLHHTHEDGSPYPPHDCPVFRAMQTGTGMRVTDEATMEAVEMVLQKLNKEITALISRQGGRAAWRGGSSIRLL